MRDFSELNINEGGRAVKRPTPTPHEFDQFEKVYGVPVPEGLRALLSYANGGHPEADSIFLSDSSEDADFAVNCFYYLSSEYEKSENLVYALTHWRNVLGSNKLPFAEDSGGSQFFLDLADSPASVKICLHDDNMRIVKISESFEAFIDALKIDPNMI